MCVVKWLKKKLINDKEITDEYIDELMKKSTNLKRPSDNPYNKELHKKLNEYLQFSISSKDNFVNWITGLSTGILFFAFTKFEILNKNTEPLLIVGLVSFSTICFAIIFKISLSSRFSIMELEIEIVKTLWEGYKLQEKLKEILNKGEKIGNELKKDYVKNQEQSLKLLDDKYMDKLRKSGRIKLKALEMSYAITVILFTASIFLLSRYFFKSFIIG